MERLLIMKYHMATKCRRKPTESHYRIELQGQTRLLGPIFQIHVKAYALPRIYGYISVTQNCWTSARIKDYRSDIPFDELEV